MKKYLLPEGGKFYKANLHCHTNISDGKWSPEEVKKNYMEKGYSVIAYTDHQVMVPHHDLTDENFLALTGLEYNINEYDVYPAKNGKTCHLCAIALDPEKEIQPCWHREKYISGHTEHSKHLAKFDESKPDWEREYTHECVNEIIAECIKEGFFVTYNHPKWSLEGYDRYMGYEGMNAMEVYNHECYIIGYDERNSKIYDDMLKGGKRIFCVATDDNHNGRGESSFGGFTMIKADKLEYREITKSLKAGNFYASEGPIINELWIEDDTVHITFEDAAEVCMNTQYRFAKSVKGYGYPLTEASFKLTGKEGYVRFTVLDKFGKKAYTNAYFIDEIMGGAK